MIDILHAFAVGIAFAVGVAVGATLCSIATRQGRKELIQDLEKHRAVVEQRLLGSMNAHTRMAEALEKVADRERTTP